MVENPAPVNQSVSTAPKPGKNSILVILGLLLILILIGVGFLVFEKKVVILPKNLNGREVKQTYIDYDLNAKVLKAEQTSAGFKLTTDLPQGYPEVLINKDTTIKVSVSGKTKTLVNIPDLVKIQNQNIGIIARYFFKTHSWKIVMVTFYTTDLSAKNVSPINRSPLPATSSGILKK